MHADIAEVTAAHLRLLDERLPERAVGLSVENLRSSWQPWLDGADQHLRTGVVTDAELELAATWLVFGVPRLHALLATDEIVSTSQTARCAAERFPEHADLARRCLAHRQGTPQRLSVADARAGADLGRAAIADAERRWRRVGSAAQ